MNVESDICKQAMKVIAYSIIRNRIRTGASLSAANYVGLNLLRFINTSSLYTKYVVGDMRLTFLEGLYSNDVIVS